MMLNPHGALLVNCCSAYLGPKIDLCWQAGDSYDGMEMALVLGIAIVAVVLFALERFRVDFVALLVLGTLLALGLVTPEEGLSGFSNSATVTVAAMFVLSAALKKTGALQAVGNSLTHLRGPTSLLLLTIIAVAALLSAFVNNTGTVAVLLPLVVGVGLRRKISPSKLLIPLSYASQFGGVCTLIGTSTNLVVSSISQQHGFGRFSMFEFTGLGLIMLTAGAAYLMVFSKWLLPTRRSDHLIEAYNLRDYITELRILEGSPLIDKTLVDVNFGERFDAVVLEILRQGNVLWPPLHERLREGDILLVRGKIKNLVELQSAEKLEIEPQERLRDRTLQSKKVMLLEALVAPGSHLVNATLSQLHFRRRFNAIVLAIQRHGQVFREKLSQTRLQPGDVLLLQIPREEVTRLRRDENFILLQEVDEPILRRDKIPIALTVIGFAVGLAALGVAPILVTAILGAIAVVMTGCLTLEEAYHSIEWKVIFLLAGILPLGIAMEKTGGAQLLAQHLVGLVDQFGPFALLAAIYLTTAVLTECLTNNAAAVLVTPIAISTALALELDPKPFMMAVCFAASTSFATPVGYQTNTMVFVPGGYKFVDYMKIGIPLNLLFWGLAVFFIPKFWPF